MVNAKWVEPVLTWANQPFTTVRKSQPQILELTTDTFLKDFMDGMKLDAPVSGAVLAKPAGEPKNAGEYLKLHQKEIEAGNSDAKLFQPLHGCFYITLGSLVCDQVGLPDWDFKPKQRESVFFVVRRLSQSSSGGEEGWDEQLGWQPVSEGLLPHEERLPMHPVKVRIQESDSRNPCPRTIYYGYIPTGGRDKYADKVEVTKLAGTTPQDQVNSYFSSFINTNDFEDEVVKPWKQFIKAESAKNTRDVNSIADNSAKIVVAFAKYLKFSLPTIWTAILNQNIQKDNNGNDFPNAPHMLNNLTPTNTKMLALYTLIEEYKIPSVINAGDPPLPLSPAQITSLGNVFRSLTDALTLQNIINRVDLSRIMNPVLPLLPKNIVIGVNDTAVEIDIFTQKIMPILSAIATSPPELTSSETESNKVLALIKGMIRPTTVRGKYDETPVVDHFAIRLVYEYDPDCPPIMSAVHSIPYVYAPFFDADAPARMVRIEMPSIKPADIRKFSKGVGIQMSRELNNKLDSVNKDMLKGDPPSADGLGQFAMVCTFSIQIITLVALILMFIILILLNIIFQWMAFLRICLPIPKKVL